MRVKLYGLAGSPNVRGAMLGLAEKTVEYELVPVAPPFKDSEHLARNPLGRIPVLEHDGFLVYETTAILRHVDRAFAGPALQPQDQREATRMDQILSVVDSYLGRTWGGAIGFERLLAAQFFGRPADMKQIDEALPLARSCAEALESLAAEPFLTGSTFCLADIRVAPFFDWLRQTPEREDVLSGKDRLARWFEQVAARPSARAVLEPMS